MPKEFRGAAFCSPCSSPLCTNSKQRGARAGAAPSSVPAEVGRSCTKHLGAKDLSLPLPGLIPPSFQVQAQVHTLAEGKWPLQLLLWVGMVGAQQEQAPTSSPTPSTPTSRVWVCKQRGVLWVWGVRGRFAPQTRPGWFARIQSCAPVWNTFIFICVHTDTSSSHN